MAFDNEELATILNEEYRDTKRLMNELVKVTSEALTVLSGPLAYKLKSSILLPEEMEVANEELKDLYIQTKELTLLETYWEEFRAGIRYARMDITRIRKIYRKMGCSIHNLSDMEIYGKRCEAIDQDLGEHGPTLSKMFERIEGGIGCLNYVNLLRRNTKELKSATKILIFLRSMLNGIICLMSIVSHMLCHTHKSINEYLEWLKAEEKLRVTDLVSELALQFIEGPNISCDYTVPEEVNAAGCQIYADEMESAIICAVRMVTGDNSNTGKAIARESGILTDKGLAIEGAEFQEKSEKELRERIPEMQNYSDMKRSFIEIRVMVYDTLNVLRLHMDSFHCVSIHKSMAALIFENKEWKLVNIQIKELMVLKTYMEEFRTAMHNALKELLRTMKIYKEIGCSNHILSDIGRYRRLCVAIDQALAVLGPTLRTMYELMYPEFKWLEVEGRIRRSNHVELLKNYKKELNAARQILIVLWPKLKNIYDLMYNALEVLRQTRERIYEYPERLKAEQADNWSQIPNDLLSKVVNRLTTIEDFTACSLVCRNWRSFCSNMNWTQGPQPPWLMLSENPNSNRRRFFSLYNNKCYELELPMVYGRRCYGTAEGWIIAIGPDLQAYLFHPLSQVKLDLPELYALQNQVDVLTDSFNFIQKLIAFKISHDQFLVMAIYGPLSYLAYAKTGDREWVNLWRGQSFIDVTLFRDDYYALCVRGTLVLCILSGHDAGTHFVDFPPRNVRTTDKMYLVESSGELLAVFRYGSANVSEQCYETERFETYKYLFDVPDLHDDSVVVPKWERVRDLKDCALFIGASNSWSICTSNNVNCKRNCIYFTDDNWGMQRTIGETYGGHDIGVFDMASEKIEHLKFGLDCPSYYFKPIWLTPTVQ